MLYLLICSSQFCFNSFSLYFLRISFLPSGALSLFLQLCSFLLPHSCLFVLLIFSILLIFEVIFSQLFDSLALSFHFLKDRISLHRYGWPRAGDAPASASWMQGLQIHITTPYSFQLLYFHFLALSQLCSLRNNNDCLCHNLDFSGMGTIVFPFNNILTFPKDTSVFICTYSKIIYSFLLCIYYSTKVVVQERTLG